MKLKDSKISKFFKENVVGKIINSAVLGAIKGVPMLGNIVTEIKANQDDELTGKGKTNKTRLVFYIMVGGLMLGRIFYPEVINTHLFGELIDLLTKISG